MASHISSGKSRRASTNCWCQLNVGFVAVVVLATATSVLCYPQNYNHQRLSQFAARRAADDSRPLTRVLHRREHESLQESQDSVVVGKFKAPAPERIQRVRIPKSSNSGAQALSASYRVADASDSLPEKVVHGVTGASASNNRRSLASPQQQQQQQQSVSRTVGAKMMVSDEGLNYPPSKLSADIYGNVAEIVTAPPEAVDSDFLIPQSNRFFGNRRALGQQQP